MSKDKYKITRLTNRKPIDISKIQTIEKDGGIVMNYHETIITQIVEAQEKREFECICAEIQKFIEENNIGVCFAINKNELTDCLQEHQRLKLEIMELKSQLALTEKALELACEEYSKLYCEHYCHRKPCGECENGDYKFFKDNFLEQAKEMKSE